MSINFRKKLILAHNRINAQPGKYKVGDREIYFRSKLEWRCAKYLQFLKEQNQIAEWEYEPKTFYFTGIKRGATSYKPDFLVTRPDKTHYWIECKGYLDPKSATKIKRFKKYFPEEHLELVRTELINNSLVGQMICAQELLPKKKFEEIQSKD